MVFSSLWPSQNLGPLGSGWGDALPALSPDAPGLAGALYADAQPGARDALGHATRQGLAAALAAYGAARGWSSDAPDNYSSQSSVAGAPRSSGPNVPASATDESGANAPDTSPQLARSADGIAPPPSLAHRAPDLTLDASTGPDSNGPGSAPVQRAAGSQDAPSPPTIYQRWVLPNGQVARQFDVIQGPNVVYHHGDLGGAPGVYVDDPDGPDGPRTYFTPTGPNLLATTPGFYRSPEIGPGGQPYYDQQLWEHGGRQGFLRVDGQGNPVKAFVLDSGEAHEAASPTDYLGPGEYRLLLDVGLAAAVKAGAPAALKALGAKFAASGIASNAERAAADAAAEPIVQLGGAHRDVQGLAGYEAHHMPADSATSLSKGEGPAIAMRPEDHR